MGDSILRKRSEIPVADTWNMEDMFASDEAWEQEYDLVLELAENMKSYKGRLMESGQLLLAYMKKWDELTYHQSRVYVYANQRYHQDTACSKYQGYVSLAERMAMQAAEAVAFAKPELLGIPEEKLERFFTECDELASYKRKIHEILRLRQHTLSDAEERILAQASEVMAAPSNIFSMLHNADMKFPSIRDVEGNRIQITNASFVPLQKNRHRKLRKQVYEAYYQTLEKWENTIASTYLSQVKTDLFRAQVTKYRSAREMYLMQGNIPESVYDSLIEAVHEALPDMYRYVAVRKKRLGVDKLQMYDMYVPLVEGQSKSYSFEEAKDLIIKALAPMGEEYIAILKEGFNNRWIDIYQNENKRSGAYSWGAYGTHPYVLLNFQGDLDSVFTLAHEMGHAIHSYLSDQTQPVTYAEYLIFVAEVASTCNENLLIHYMLEHAQDEREKEYLLNHYIEKFRATVFRQTMFAEFEKIVHERMEAGEALTGAELKGIYHDLVQLYFGPDLVVDSEIEMEWMRIPHFYTPFYVYQYATGFSAATAFSKMILEEKEVAVKRYMGEFLRGGSSKDPIDLLAAAGVDMSSPEPVKSALTVFGNYVDMFEKDTN